MASLTLRNIRKSFGKVDAVRGLDLQIHDGEFVSLLGPSGCGKSTTLRLIAGFGAPDEGEVRLGESLVSSGEGGVVVPPDKRDIGLVFQSYALWPHMSVERNVTYGLRARRFPKDETKERAREALRMMQMDGYAERYPSELSGGQQQRISLARAIAYRPRLLLLDEPLSNLDAKLRDQMRVEIRELQQRLGFTAVYVTHDQAEAMAMSDRIAVMSGGTIHQVGTPEDIYENPATSFVAEFIGNSNMLSGTVRAGNLKGGTVVVEVLNGIELESRAGTAISAGGPAAVCIRAESFGITSAADSSSADGQEIEGTVRVATYQGGSWHYYVDVSNEILEVRAPAKVRLDAGERVVLTVSPADCIATVPVEHVATEEAA